MCETSLLEQFLWIKVIKEVNIPVPVVQTVYFYDVDLSAGKRQSHNGKVSLPADCISIIAERKHLFFIGPQLKRHFYREPDKNLSSV